ncbi:hypothetical protein Ancab_014944 [Ancistrocladus abbreviatus]
MACGKISLAAALAMAVLMVWLSSTITTAKAQESCASTLTPCLQFLNSTAKPTPSCCDPLASAVKTQKACLCALFNDKSLLKSINVNITRVLELPKDCGFSASEASVCASSPAPSPSPSSASVPPPSGNGAAGSTTWTGLSSLLILWMASLMVY